jgi:hypothetical protein
MGCRAVPCVARVCACVRAQACQEAGGGVLSPAESSAAVPLVRLLLDRRCLTSLVACLMLWPSLSADVAAALAAASGRPEPEVGWLSRRRPFPAAARHAHCSIGQPVVRPVVATVLARGWCLHVGPYLFAGLLCSGRRSARIASRWPAHCSSCALHWRCGAFG